MVKCGESDIGKEGGYPWEAKAEVKLQGNWKEVYMCSFILFVSFIQRTFFFRKEFPLFIPIDFCVIKLYVYITFNIPCGKESTEVRKSQIKGNESENSYQELKRSQNACHFVISSIPGKSFHFPFP